MTSKTETPPNSPFEYLFDQGWQLRTVHQMTDHQWDILIAAIGAHNYVVIDCENHRDEYATLLVSPKGLDNIALLLTPPAGVA